MSDLIFISSALQQPRHQKRIDLLRKSFNLDIFYFERDKYIENYKDYPLSSTKVGKMVDGKYWGRIFIYIRLLFILIRHSTKKVYCTSPDQALISILAGKKVIMEAGDLYQVDGKNRVFKILDYFILPRLSGLVITSPFFYSGYFYKFDNFLRDKTIVVENKLPIEFLEKINLYRGVLKSESKIINRKLGLVGSLAFKESLLKIKDFIVSHPEYELNIYGDGLYTIFDGIPNVSYHGRFRSPEDLPDIYANIDVNIILYDYGNNNVKLALPNKLYESIAFLTPILCASNVALSEYVCGNGLGEAVENDDIAKTLETIFDNYDLYIHNLEKMGVESYLCYEQEKILKLMMSI